MKSKRPLLSNAELLRNDRRLAKARQNAETHYDKTRVNELFDIVQYQLFEEAVKLGIATEEKKLKALIKKALELKYSNAVFIAEMKVWIDNYRALENAESAATLKDVARATSRKNITDSLLAGEDIQDVWGDDRDLDTVLRGYVVHPDSVYASKDTYVEPSAPLSTLAHVEAMVRHIQQIIAKNPDGVGIKLLIPVNQSQTHWQLAQIRLDKGRITEADVIDNSDSDYTNATLTNLQMVVNKVNAKSEKAGVASKDKVYANAEITGVVTNGNKCMHAVAQQVFKRKALLPGDVTAQALANAKSPQELLSGVVGKIFENHSNVAVRGKDAVGKVSPEEAKAKAAEKVAAEAKAAAARAQEEKNALAEMKARMEALKAEASKAGAAAKAEAAKAEAAKAKAVAEAKSLADAKMRESVKTIFTTEVDVESIHKKLANSDNRNIQIDFDRELAIELSKGVHFGASWKSAYQNTLTKFGLFTTESKSAVEKLVFVEDKADKKRVL